MESSIKRDQGSSWTVAPGEEEEEELWNIELLVYF
jgi:hypothetical protein